MDEVVGEVDVLPRSHEARRVGDVADVEVEPRRFEPVRLRAVANQAPDR
jgi:hypothetical protein